ncbi:MAG: hypothetical protein R3D80_21730 [Paracoccaceae bacterium]
MIGPRSRTGLALLGVALYGGPVLAGLALHDWSVLPVLAALFLLYFVASRRPDLRSIAGRANLATVAVVQVALVTIGWAIGRGLADIVGAVALPLWAPLAITAVAAGIGAWAFRDAAEMDVMLDSALARLAEMETRSAPSRPLDVAWPDPEPGVDAAVRRALDALRALPAIEPARIDPIMHRLNTEAGAAGFDPLYDAAGREGSFNEPVVDFALLRFCALPQIFDQLVARGEARLSAGAADRAGPAGAGRGARTRRQHGGCRRAATSCRTRRFSEAAPWFPARATTGFLRVARMAARPCSEPEFASFSAAPDR